MSSLHELNSTTWRVMILHVTTKFEFQYMQRDIEKLQRALGPDCELGMHGSKSFAVACLTKETSLQLRVRIASFLEDVTGIDNFWCQSAPVDLVGMYGEMDPFQFRVTRLLVKARELNRPQNVRYPKRRQ